MAKTDKYTQIHIPVWFKKELEQLKIHPRQPLWEVISLSTNIKQYGGK